MDLYEDGLYFLMLVAATVLVASVITLMTKSMLKKKPKSAGELTIPARVSARQLTAAKLAQESSGEPEEQRQEQLQQDVAPAKQLQQAPERHDEISEASDEREAEVEIELEAEDATEDTMETGQVALPGIEKENSLLTAVEAKDEIMSLFQSVENDNSELAELAARLPDVDLDSLKILSQETFLALSKRAAGKKEE